MTEVAPRIGVRGLKSIQQYREIQRLAGRTSYWGAWIEIARAVEQSEDRKVAPRIGVRGLKSKKTGVYTVILTVAPRIGVRGLKFSKLYLSK